MDSTSALGYATENLGTQFIIIILCLFLAYMAWTINGWRGKPPGPWGFPIMGHLPLLGSKPLEKLFQYQRQYGDIFSLRMGSSPGVMLCGKNIIKEALINKADDFAGRKENEMVDIFVAGGGVTFSDFGERWKAHRKIADRVLGIFASNKIIPIDDLITEEAKQMVTIFEEMNGRPFDPHDEIFLNVGSVLFQMLYGRQENIREDPLIRELVLDMQKLHDSIETASIEVLLPWTRYFVPGKLRKMKELADRGDISVKRRVEEHKQSFDRDNIRDITDALIGAASDIDENEMNRIGLKESQITDTIKDFIGAGFHPVATTLYWSLLYMTCYPNVQSKVQDEMDRIVGIGRYPGLKDRGNLPYTEATILELLRITSLAPLAIPHKTTRDTCIGGFSIPKDTDVYINLYSIHMDCSWGDPKIFRPERFLTSTGELDALMIENILPFSAGRRRCLAEHLAKVELFLFFSFMLQQFKYTPPPNETLNLEANFGFNLKPNRYKIVATPRI